MNFYVYEHWRLDRDECFYVGKGQKSRAYDRLGRNAHWWNIVKKLERIGSSYEIKIYQSGLSEKEAFLVEVERITFWRDISDLANKTNGGEGFSGGRHTPESKARRGRGSRLTAAKYRKKNSERMRGEKNPFYGKTHRPETRELISKRLTGKNTGPRSPLTPAQRQRISETLKNKKIQPPSQKGAKFSEETKRKISASVTAYYEVNPKPYKPRSEEARRKTSESLRKHHAQKKLLLQEKQ